ncbi:MAG: hypothetical protein R6U84_01400 [Candidatus Cloacimonadales bacterium]
MKMPSGRLVSPQNMFKPEALTDYYHWQFQNIDIYLEKKLSKSNAEFDFLIANFGRFYLEQFADKIIIS